MRILPGGCRVFDPSDGEKFIESNWTCRTLACRKNGAIYIAQTVSQYGTGRSPVLVNPAAEEVLYVASGRGICRIGGFSYKVEPGVGIYVPPGAEYSFENGGPEELLVIGVCCPEDERRRIVEGPRPASSPSGRAPRRLVREREREPIPVADRQFKLMVDKDLGCQRITQFVGFIPPSRAPFHYHPYEEAIFVLEGAGIVHVEGDSCVFGAGSGIFLPIGVRHCLENPGPRPVRLLGVFYPCGSPAEAYEN